MRELCKILDIEITQKQEKQFQIYMELLLEYNQKFNLTAITKPNEIIIKHFYDSILIKHSKLWTGKGRIADLGTGAGFPGIPLKIIYPELELLLLDSSAKKINFLKYLSKEINLDKIEALHMRAEDAGQNKLYRQSFDWVVTRAMASMPVLAEYCLPLLNNGGFLAAYKGPGWADELELSKNAVKLLGGQYKKVIEESLPNDYGKRAILFFEKIAETPKIYPRKAGIPSKKAL